MNLLQVKQVSFGDGIPKIIVPVTAAMQSELIDEIKTASAARQTDIIEWRADCYEEDLQEAMKTISQMNVSQPVLVTWRTKAEGGNADISEERYAEYILMAAASGADMIDIELSHGKAAVNALTLTCHSAGIPVVMSSHDFSQTPSLEDCIHILTEMVENGADICKLAVMPKSEEDVLNLLQATQTMRRNYPEKLFATMSMGQLGVVSRLCGELSGSCMTFGTIGAASAPGQIPAQQLREILDIIHGNAPQN